jgi:hypothetical protein
MRRFILIPLILSLIACTGSKSHGHGCGEVNYRKESPSAQQIPASVLKAMLLLNF